MIGKTISHFKILKKLGAGGMGEVYLAEDTRLDRKVALKFLPLHFTADTESLARFEREAKATAALNHPNIITVHEIGDHENQTFIAMEYVEGESLRERMAKELSLNEILDLVTQICAGLGKAHQADVVHRDIKPENIMIDRDGRVRILDFGLAKLKGVTKLTREASTLGTLNYMSPEQFQALEVDHRTDIWSLGVILYEMITGEMPFTGEYEAAVMYSVLNEDMAAITSSQFDVPDQLQQVVNAALAKNADERYQHVDELLADLKKLFLVDDVSTAKSSSQKSTVTASNNLPLQLTNFIGRKRELKEVKELFSTVRLLTLTGTAGTGKTRLGLEVAADLLDDFQDGIFFVPLAPVSDPELVVTTIAEIVGIKEGGEKAIIEKLNDSLQDKQVLLLLDNLEHLVAARNVVLEILSACPNVKILITSREPLNVQGESQFRLQPLELPDLEDEDSVEDLSENETVKLFIERACAVKPNFALAKDNAQIVAQICIQLDGLPLAIELAAVRIKLFPPQALLARLKNRLNLLTGGPHDLPDRQKTLRGAIEWSYDLLSEPEKILLRRLSVFLDGCTLDAAESVCNAELEQTHGKESNSIIDVLEGLGSLVDKNLLRQEEQQDGEPRFVMLETVREFGIECLTTSGEVEAFQTAHMEFFLKFSKDALPFLTGPQQAMWLERFQQEHNNLRAALDYSLSKTDTPTGLELASTLWRFWEIRGYLTEGRTYTEKLLALETTPKPTKTRLKVLYAAGVLADAQSDYKAARSYFEQHLAINRKLGDKWGIASSLNNLGIITLREEDLATSHSLYEEVIAIWRELDNKGPLALALNNLGNVASQQGDHAGACSLHEESTEIFKELGDKRGIACSLNHLANVACNQGNTANARTLFEESLAMFRELGIQGGIANLLIDLGNLNFDEQDYTNARSLFEESLQIFGELGDRRGIASLLQGFVGLADAQGKPEQALRLAGAAEKLREKIGLTLPKNEKEKLEHRIKHAQKGLPKKEFLAEWEQGRSMTLNKAIEYALTIETE